MKRLTEEQINKKFDEIHEMHKSMDKESTMKKINDIMIRAAERQRKHDKEKCKATECTCENQKTT